MASSENDDKTSSQPPGPVDSPPQKVPAEFGMLEHARALVERYELLQLLGRGGMGIVYKARDKVSGDLIALKLLDPEIASHPGQIERFKSELRLARKVTHKNVCRVYDVARFGGVYALSMEYVEGETLRQALRRDGTLSVRHGLKLIHQVIDALDEAHRQGVVHRDLKPENIIVSSDGTVKVMDFGLARSTTADTFSTAPGAVFGTPAYMSPEQAAGKPADHRSDIYALGLILYEMFVGKKAFEADTPVALALKHIHDTPQPPASLEPDLPVRIDKAILRCLEKEPKKRFNSVRELDAALTSHGPFEFQTPPSPTAVELPSHLSFWQRRDWVLLGAGISALAVFLLVFEHAFPYRFFELGLSHEAAVTRAREIVRTFAPELNQDNLLVIPEFEYELLPYPGEALSEGVKRVELKYQLYAKSWRIVIPREVAQSNSTTIEFDARGQILNVSLTQARKNLDSKSSSPAEILPFAARCANDLFRVNVSNTQPVEMGSARETRDDSLRPESPMDTKLPPGLLMTFLETPYSKSPYVAWRLPGDTPGKEEYILISANNGRLSTAARFIALPQEEWSFSWLPWLGPGLVSALQERNTLIWASIVGATFVGLLALLAIFLSIGRRLYLQTEPSLFLVASVGAIAVSYLVWNDWLRLENMGAWAVVPLLASCVLGLLLIYSVLSSTQNYLLRVLPSQAKTFLSFIRRPYDEQSVGFSILRGIALGCLFLGAHAIGVWLVSKGRLGAPSAMWLFIYGRGELDVLSGLSLATLVTIAAGWVLLAFPISLLQRTGSKLPSQFISVAVLWSVSTATLPGASLNPLWLVYLLAALQGVFFALLLFRWDFLTCLTAMFTVESWLICYPIFRIFAKTDPLTYALGLLPWLALAMLGAVIALRPNILIAWRRLKVVFD